MKDLDENNTRMEAYLRKLLKNINKKIESAERDIERYSTNIKASEVSGELDEDHHSVSTARDNKSDLENAVERYKKIRGYIEMAILAEENLQEINEDYMDCLPEEIDNKQDVIEKMTKIERKVRMAKDRDTLDEFDIYTNTYSNFASRISQIQ